MQIFLFTSSDSRPTGKWYDCNKGQLADIPVPDVRIQAGVGVGRVCGSGTKGSWSGVEGAFKIYEISVNKTLSHIHLYNVYFDLPFGPTSNKFHVTKSESKRSDAYELLVATPNLAEVNNMPLVYLFISNTKQEKLRVALNAIEQKASTTQ